MTTNIINLDEYRRQRAEQQREIGVTRLPCPIRIRRPRPLHVTPETLQRAPISPDADPVREKCKPCPQSLAA